MAGRRCRRRALGVGAAGAAEPGVRLAGRCALAVWALHGVRSVAAVSRVRHVTAPRRGPQRERRGGLGRRRRATRRSCGDRNRRGGRLHGRARAGDRRALRGARPAAHGVGVDLPVEGRDVRLHPRLLDRDHHRPVRQAVRRRPRHRHLCGGARVDDRGARTTRAPPRSPSAQARSCCCWSCATSAPGGRAP